LSWGEEDWGAAPPASETITESVIAFSAPATSSEKDSISTNSFSEPGSNYGEY
jgi:hypothetical protein